MGRTHKSSPVQITRAAADGIRCWLRHRRSAIDGNHVKAASSSVRSDYFGSTLYA